ncbi:hypothetical protein IG631_07491 [Alternaria alternata]|nr:hypothetical protein IG631_07491 [Alternaria alternata]
MRDWLLLMVSLLLPRVVYHIALYGVPITSSTLVVEVLSKMAKNVSPCVVLLCDVGRACTYTTSKRETNIPLE